MSPEAETPGISEVPETLRSPEVSISPEAPEISSGAPEISSEAPEASWGKVVGMRGSSSSC